MTDPARHQQPRRHMSGEKMDLLFCIYMARPNVTEQASFIAVSKKESGCFPSDNVAPLVVEGELKPMSGLSCVMADA